MATQRKRRPSKSKRADAAAWQEAESRILENTNVQAAYESLGIIFTGREPNAAGWLECHAHGRDDNTPSAAVNVAGDPPLLGRYKDSGGDSERTLALWNFAAEFGNGQFQDWKAARQHYAESAGVELPDAKSEPRRPIDRVKTVEWNDTLAALWCLKKPGVTLGSLKAAGARLVKYPANYTDAQKCIALPAYGSELSAGDPTGFILWNQTGLKVRIYNGKDKPATFNKMATLGNGWIVLGDISTAKATWKTEGPGDLLTLWAVLMSAGLTRDVAAFTNCCGSEEHPDAKMIAAHLTGKAVNVVHDADASGEVGGKRWASAIAVVASEVRRVMLPYEVLPKHGKDLRDWVNEGHSFDELQQLAAGSEVVPGPAAGSKPHEANGELQVIEADDDPHRLAKLYLKREGVIFWRNGWWKAHGNSFCQVEDKELKAVLTRLVKEEFDRINIERQQFGGDSEDGPPQVQKINRNMMGNVLGALEGIAVVSEK